jgi:hypothetical protein
MDGELIRDSVSGLHLRRTIVLVIVDCRLCCMLCSYSLNLSIFDRGATGAYSLVEEL